MLYNVHIIEYYTAMKSNKLKINATWTNLQNTMSKEARYKKVHISDMIYT